LGLVRLFLALVVANDHWRTSILMPAGTDSSALFLFNAGQAVVLFYIISGFLITYTLTHNYAPDRWGAAQFYGNRFVRIFSLYWPLAAFSGFAFVGYQDLVSTSALDLLTQTFILGQDWSVALGAYPQSSNFAATLPGLHQSWTLGAELSFYLIAPFLMRTWRGAAAILVLSLLTRGALIFFFGKAAGFPTWLYYFFPSTVCFFLLGHLVCRASSYFQTLRWPHLAMIAPAMLPAVPMLYHLSDYMRFDTYAFDNVPLWASIAMLTVSLPALFAATKNSRILNYLGDLSYPIYLTHTFVLSFSSGLIVKYVLPFGTGYSVTAFLMLVVIASIASHHLIERPAARLMRYLAAKARPAPVQAIWSRT
jgi:peptidoglycan/LPS O-acetylase OafA/YrhL